MSEPENPRFPRLIDREIAEHEVFLSFNSDWEAVAFQEWWNATGRKQFWPWAEKRKEGYR